MSPTSQSLLDTAKAGTPAAEGGEPVLVPLEGEGLFLELAAEIFRHMASEPGGAAVLFMDGRTAHSLPPLDSPPLAALDVRILGGELPAWCEGLSVQTWTAVDPIHGKDRFCIAAGSACQAALVAEHTGPPFHGAWTTDADTVRMLAVRLVSTMTDGPEWPPTPGAPATASERLLQNLARVHTMQRTPLPAVHRDLYSVLEILKAISAERRSSDILYVFAEGVARVVPMDRCSVVRIWGDQRQGHVLASHEDDRVHDLTIDLSLYPEIREVLRKGTTVVIDSVRDDPLTESVREQLEAARIKSIAVVPIVVDDPEVGSLLLRAARRDRAFDKQETGFFEIVTQAASNALERAHLLENLQLANEHLERMAITDGLTGLHNHRYFIEQLASEVNRAKRYGTPLTCVFMDIDNFKGLNDTYGHVAGDAVLREAAKRITGVMRKVDTTARYGGEEFTLILPQTGVEGAETKAEIIRALIADEPFQCVGDGVTVTMSIGVAMYCPETMEDHLALCRAADRALYISKRNGKNRVTVGRSHP